VSGFAAPLVTSDPSHICMVVSGDEIEVTSTGRVDASAPYLPGHFPGLPIWPGVFVLESVRQAVAHALGGSRPSALLGIKSLRFSLPLFGGDDWVLVTRLPRERRGPRFRVQAQCRRSDGTLVARVDLLFRGGQ
jgi:3-hydroxyacyl-[acyl-carrier-protein] dehydratase